MTKTVKPSDVLGRMKAAATREKPVSTAPEPVQPEVSPPMPDAAATTAALPVKARKVRFTLDLEPDQHKSLKRFAVEAEADAAEVLRALLALLHSDPAVKNAVLTAISKEA